MFRKHTLFYIVLVAITQVAKHLMCYVTAPTGFSRGVIGIKYRKT